VRGAHRTCWAGFLLVGAKRSVHKLGLAATAAVRGVQGHRGGVVVCDMVSVIVGAIVSVIVGVNAS